MPLTLPTGRVEEGFSVDARGTNGYPQSIYGRVWNLRTEIMQGSGELREESRNALMPLAHAVCIPGMVGKEHPPTPPGAMDGAWSAELPGRSWTVPTRLRDTDHLKPFWGERSYTDECDACTILS